MNAVAYGFRDDITDEELALLEAQGVIFECDEHGVWEEVDADTLDRAVAALRRPAHLRRGKAKVRS